jgi:hypothetical protein
MTDLSQRTQSLGGPEYFTWNIYERNNINVNVNFQAQSFLSTQQVLRLMGETQTQV